jgi:hypothetical protein
VVLAEVLLLIHVLLHIGPIAVLHHYADTALSLEDIVTFHDILIVTSF